MSSTDPCHRFAPRRDPTLHRIVTVATLLLALLVGAALAQAEVSGTATGTIDGEAAAWSTYTQERQGQMVNTASWIEPMPGTGIRSYTILAQTEPVLFGVSEGAIMISIETLGEIGPCPCAFADAELVFFTEKTFSSNFYVTNDATVTFDVLEELDGDTFRVTGSFAGEPAFRADFMTPEDREDTVMIEGTFEIERMSREPEGE
jgi:hypothetical protein